MTKAAIDRDRWFGITANNNTNAATCIKIFGVYLQHNVNGNVKNNKSQVVRKPSIAVDQKTKGIYYVKKLLLVLVYRK